MPSVLPELRCFARVILVTTAVLGCGLAAFFVWLTLRFGVLPPRAFLGAAAFFGCVAVFPVPLFVVGLYSTRLDRSLPVTFAVAVLSTIVFAWNGLPGLCLSVLSTGAAVAWCRSRPGYRRVAARLTDRSQVARGAR